MLATIAMWTGKFEKKVFLTHNSEEIVEKDSSTYVDDDICPEDAKIPPAILVGDSEARKEDIGVPDGAELALSSSTRVE